MFILRPQIKPEGVLGCRAWTQRCCSHSFKSCLLRNGVFGGLMCLETELSLETVFALKVITLCRADRQTKRLQTSKKISLNGVCSEENTNQDEGKSLVGITHTSGCPQGEGPRRAVQAKGTEGIKTLRQEKGWHIWGTARGSARLEFTAGKGGSRWCGRGRRRPDPVRPPNPSWGAWVLRKMRNHL